MRESATVESRRAGPVAGDAQAAVEAELRRAIFDHLLFTCAKDRRDATGPDLYRAMTHTVRDRLVQRWLTTQRTYLERDVKRVYYLSSEFLTGRSLGLCLLNLGLYDAAARIVREAGFDLGAILDCEGDPGLGNGGLGRLAACFMDSLATLGLPAVGCGIRYEYGIFEQRIENGQQVEHTDGWLQAGNPWELPCHDQSQEVRFYGKTQLRKDERGRLHVDWVDTQLVIGVPYDSFIVGHETNTVNTLRLWAARASRDFDLHHFNAGDYRRAVEEKVEVENLSKVLYPNDQTDKGKELRLKQQYFFVACAIADMVATFKRNHSDLRRLPERSAVQLNDTHPAVAVAELMRVLLDQEGLEWDAAWEITRGCIAYTNHTLLPEALEKWSLPLFGHVLPRHLQIIYEINHRFLREVSTHWPHDFQRLERMSIIEEGPVQQVRMAHLAVVGSHSVNGVAALHTELLKADLLADFHALHPDRINNKTNGVTPRRWLLHANPGLADLLARRVGPDFMQDGLARVPELTAQASDPALLDELDQIKRSNKRRLATALEARLGVSVDPASMFITQIKRIHEYKRQLMACLELIAHYLELKANPALEGPSRTYIFAGKAAAGYHVAKQHIRLINDVAGVVNGDPSVRDRMRVLFVPNYGVTLAELIIPAADISLQISQAGKEASGTSNMKLALNGALTVGTLDGANVEIRDAVGAENFFLCGLNVDEVRTLNRRGYDPQEFAAASPALEGAIALIDSDFFCLGDKQRFEGIAAQLRYADHYMCCADFDSYRGALRAADALFLRPRDWARQALFNVAGASRFTSDATILGYAREIWQLSRVPIESG